MSSHREDNNRVSVEPDPTKGNMKRSSIMSLLEGTRTHRRIGPVCRFPAGVGICFRATNCFKNTKQTTGILERSLKLLHSIVIMTLVRHIWPLLPRRPGKIKTECFCAYTGSGTHDDDTLKISPVWTRASYW